MVTIKKSLTLPEISIRHDCMKSIICVNSGYKSKCTIPFCYDGQMSHRFYVFAFSLYFFLTSMNVDDDEA